MATHFIILALEIQWREDPGGLQFIEFQRVIHKWGNKHAWMHIFQISNRCFFEDNMHYGILSATYFLLFAHFAYLILYFNIKINFPWNYHLNHFKCTIKWLLVHSKCSTIGNVNFSERERGVDGWVGIRESAYIVVKAKKSDISATYF